VGVAEADHPPAAPKLIKAMKPIPVTLLSVVKRTVSVGEEAVHAPSADPLVEASSGEDVEGPSNSAT
jgi:hypothetical protein